MKTPIELLQERRNEIFNVYNQVLNTDYITSPEYKKYADAYKLDKEKSLNQLKEQLDLFDEAIRILIAVENCTL